MLTLFSKFSTYKHFLVPVWDKQERPAVASHSPNISEHGSL